MFWLDWIIIWVPLLIVVYFALKSQKYVKGVADFLSAGRIAGRYVVSVASGEAGQGLISVVAVMEMYYRCGFAISFWGTLTAPISMFLGLVGFCNYRFRETKAMTMGQFFEIRYGKSLRVVAAVIQSISGIINYAIFPAVGGRFLVYFLGLPLYFNFLGTTWSTYGVVMFSFLAVALIIACLGGQVTIMVTDCVQGLLSYPMYALIVGYFFYKFSWSGEMAPALVNRAPGESFLDSYDVSNLRDFNLFYVISGIVTLFFSRMSWGGSSGYNGAAKNAHEAKIGSLLGNWRGGFGIMMYILIAVVAFTYLHHQDFTSDARAVRQELAAKTIDDVIRIDPGTKESSQVIIEKAFKDEMHKRFDAIPERDNFMMPPKVVPPLNTAGLTSPEEIAAAGKLHAEAVAQFNKDLDAYHKNWDDPYPVAFLNSINEIVDGTELPGVSPEEAAKIKTDQKSSLKKKAQTFQTIYTQMIVSVAVRHILPMGFTGLFCSIMIFLMLSTDTTYMHAWGTILVQDFVIPLRKKAFTPQQQINVLRWAIAAVCAFAFFFSYYFAQIDYILMFFAITGAIWAGAGVVITLGLYWKRGTTAGAFAALISGAVIALAGIILQQTWASHVYPWLEQHQMVESVGSLLWNVSKPFHPYVQWEMSATKFPINSTEIGFICNVITTVLYLVISVATCKKPFNMDRMLHRGIYSEDAAEVEEAEHRKDAPEAKPAFSLWAFFCKNLVGIDKNYTRGDKILAWSVFIYSFVYGFVICFVMVIVWNFFSPWEIELWSWYFFIKNMLVSSIIAVVSTVWFGICGTLDLMQLFKDLAQKEVDELDDGRVEGNMSIADAARMKAIEEKEHNK